MNGYSTLLHNIAPGKYIVIKVEIWTSVALQNIFEQIRSNKKRYDSELSYQRPNLIEVMEIEIDLTTSTNVHTSFFYKSVRECLDC